MKNQITLKNLKYATKQQIFDQVSAHLLKQMERSVGRRVDGVLECRYRGENGLKCAAGALIGDDEYNTEVMEGRPLAYFARHTKGGRSIRNLAFIQRLRIIHDRTSPELWETALRDLAAKYHLRCDF